MEEITLKTYVKGIYCIQCPEIIISGLLQTRGVIDADVAYFQSLVTVTYDPEIITDEKILQLLNEMEYEPIPRRPTVSEQIASRIGYLFRGKNKTGEEQR